MISTILIFVQLLTTGEKKLSIHGRAVKRIPNRSQENKNHNILIRGNTLIANNECSHHT